MSQVVDFSGENFYRATSNPSLNSFTKTCKAFLTLSDSREFFKIIGILIRCCQRKHCTELDVHGAVVFDVGGHANTNKNGHGHISLCRTYTTVVIDRLGWGAQVDM